MREGELTKKLYQDFAGGVNLYLGSRQIKDSESPSSSNCDFAGKGGIKNRLGFTEVGAVVSSRTKGFGITEFHATGVDQSVRFASNGTNVALAYSTGGTWTEVATTTYTDNLNMDSIVAGGKLYTCNGTDAMTTWDGSAIASYATGTKGYFGAYFDKRLWVVDDTSLDTLNFSTQYGDASKSLDFTANGSSSNPGTITIKPGSGIRITGIKEFKNALYVFLNNAVYRLKTSSTVNVFTVEQVTNSVGCVSHRSITQVGEDLFFAANDGIYSLGDVGTYLDVRTQNKSAKVQKVFDALTGATKSLLVGRYFNFKYHLFYSIYGTANDSCLAYDIRYQGWQDWTNIAANDASLFTDNTKTTRFYFLTPTTGKVNQLYLGTTDGGTLISSSWYSKSFDQGLPDTEKLFLDTTFIFGALEGTITVSVIFDDSQVAVSDTISAQRPQGGYGRDVYGKANYGDATNTINVVSVVNVPKRLRAKGQKFAIQYLVTSTGNWQLDSITQTFIPFSHYKFDSADKLN